MIYILGKPKAKQNIDLYFAPIFNTYFYFT